MANERLAALFDAHSLRLYHLARRMARDHEEARDLVQEAFLRAARRASSLPEEESEAEAWLVRVLINLCRDRARRLAVRSRPHPAPLEPTVGEPGAAVVARATLTAALARLTPRRRAVLVLRELEGVPVERIAELLGIARVTVRWHLAAARAALAADLLGRTP